jgi:hypothetical protein|tara:strand:- start:2097 stop:2387 length:291 start_codon:yes stop_codon:yes gene_type:complete
MFSFLQKRRRRKQTDLFLSLMVVAKEDAAIAARLLTILNQDDLERRATLSTWIRELKFQSAPVAFTDALSCLLDDQIAERAKRLLEADDANTWKRT